MTLQTLPDVSVDGKRRAGPPAEDSRIVKLRNLCDSYETTPDDMALIGEMGIIGNPSPATAARVGSLALRLGERCVWTAADAVTILRTKDRVGENDDTFLDYESIARILGTTEDRCEKLTRLGNKWPRARRVPGASPTHHEEVCSVDPEPARLMLERAVTEHLPVSAVRELVAEWRAENPNTKPRKGRKPANREPKLPTGPATVDPMAGVGTVVDVHTGLAHVAKSNGHYVPEDAAPVGKPPSPSLVLPVNAVDAPRITLKDRAVCAKFLELGGRNQDAAERLLDEAARAFLAAKGMTL